MIRKIFTFIIFPVLWLYSILWFKPWYTVSRCWRVYSADDNCLIISGEEFVKFLIRENLYSDWSNMKFDPFYKKLDKHYGFLTCFDVDLKTLATVQKTSELNQIYRMLVFKSSQEKTMFILRYL